MNAFGYHIDCELSGCRPLKCATNAFDDETWGELCCSSSFIPCLKSIWRVITCYKFLSFVNQEFCQDDLYDSDDELYINEELNGIEDEEIGSYSSVLAHEHIVENPVPARSVPLVFVETEVVNHPIGGVNTFPVLPGKKYHKEDEMRPSIITILQN
ncbi:unnamed protein product [Orchesella dallaii]|uniref:Uncharacterized protein n=1 Tax=Orchesella dallaii TaxID=48710 RepID=A0ABP1S7I5_9HEXA